MNDHEKSSSRVVGFDTNSFIWIDDHPLVGRTREIEEIQEVWDRTIKSCVTQALSISGIAGVGKTRLVQEFIKSNLLHEKKTQIYVSAEKNEKPLQIISKVVEVAINLEDSPEEDSARAQVRKAIFSLLGKERTDDFLYFFGKLVNVDFPGSYLSQSIPTGSLEEKEILKAVFRSFLKEYTKSKQTVLVFDNLQLAHSDSLDVIRDLVENVSNTSLLIVCMFTPDLLRKNSEWLLHMDGLIEISPLSRDDVEALIGSLLFSVEELPEELVETVYDLAGGNPYFIKKILSSLVENTTIEVKERHPWTVNLVKLDSSELLLTVEDAVQARIASLSPTERVILEQAAVVGSVFWLSALVVMGRSTRPPPVLWGGSGDIAPHIEDILDGLVERDYLLKMPDSTFENDTEFAFKHNLERDLIHRMVNPVQKQLWHGLFSQWLEYNIPNRSEEFVELLALNFEKSGEELTAGKYYFKAASAARDRYANRKSLEFFQKGLELIGERDFIQRIDALHDLGDVLQRMGELEQALDIFIEMQQISWRLDIRSKGGAAHNRIGRVYRESGVLDEALRHLGTGLALFDVAGDQRGVASSLDDIGKVHWMKGEYDLALRQMRDALVIRRQIGDMRSIALSLNNLGLVHHDSGRFADALESLNEALAIRKEIEDLPGQVSSLNILGTVCLDCGDVEKSIELWQEALRLSRRIDEKMWQSSLLTNIGKSQSLLGWNEDAKKTLEQSSEIAIQLGDHLLIGESYRVLAEVLALTGDYLSARKYSVLALEQFELLGTKVNLGIALKTMGEVTAAGGWGEEEFYQALDFVSRSINIFEEIGNERELARSYLAYANLLSQAGKIDESEKYKERSDKIFGRIRSTSALQTITTSLFDKKFD